MRPTPVCVRLTARLRQSLADIDLALDEARSDSIPSRQRLQLSVMGDFANAWLIPRLEDFSQAHSDIDLSLKVHTELNPPDPNSADIGIWHRRIEEGGFRSIRLLQDRVIAVCSAGFQARHSLVSLDTLASVPLLRFETRSWNEFFQAAGLKHGEPQHGPTFSDTASLLNAALAGQGVAMLRERLVRPYLRSGALVKVGDTHIQANLDYYMTWREESPREGAILRFAEWLRHHIDEP
nr:LysR substrate-binding domain-containing protein [Paraburkholderia agricolaris]